MENQETLLVIQKVGNQMAIALTCDREELLCGLSRILLAVGVQDARKQCDGELTTEALLNATKEFALDVVKYIGKEAEEFENLMSKCQEEMQNDENQRAN